MRLNRNQSRAAEDDVAKTRHHGKGWGPFTGRQLTTIICVAVAMVMLPAGAFATVKGTSAFITDHTTGKTAKVSSSGQLSTSGSVTGSVNAALKENIAFGQVNADSTTGEVTISGPAVLTGAHVDTFTTGAGAVQLHLGTRSDCSTELTLDSVDHPPLGATVLTYGPDGVQIPAGEDLCVVNTAPGTIGAAVFLFYHH